MMNSNVATRQPHATGRIFPPTQARRNGLPGSMLSIGKTLHDCMDSLLARPLLLSEQR